MSKEKELLYINNIAKNLSEKDFVGKIYHINSKLSLTVTEESIIRATPLVLNPKFKRIITSPEKSYPGKERFSLSKVKLNMSLYDSLKNRKSHGDIHNRKKIDINEISSLTWAGYGITDEVMKRRTIPSAGALYPCELYMLSVDTELGDGLFHYCTNENCYEKLKDEKVKLQENFVSVIGLEYASAVFIITVIFDRSHFKYGERSYRFMLLEAGAIAQNISLAASALGRIATSHGGTSDIELERYLNIDGESESVIIAVGIS